MKASFFGTLLSELCLLTENPLMPSAYGVAQAYAAYNSDYLTGRRIYPRVTAIRVDQATKKVYVSLQADASSLFPSILRGVVVNGEGEAEARLQSR